MGYMNRGSYYKIPKAIFYLLKGDYRREAVLGFNVKGAGRGLVLSMGHLTVVHVERLRRLLNLPNPNPNTLPLLQNSEICSSNAEEEIPSNRSQMSKMMMTSSSD